MEILLYNDILQILEFVLSNENSAFFFSPLINGDEKSYLFKKPLDSVLCNDFDLIDETIEKVEKFSSEYDFAYGIIAYEAGYFFEEKLSSLIKRRKQKFISFQFFSNNEVEIIPAKNIKFNSIQKIFHQDNFTVSNLKLNEVKEEYVEKIKKIKNYIADGDTYQVNYTLKAKFNFTGELSAFIIQMLYKQSAGFTAIINAGEEIIISISPELFFKTEGNVIISKPMKGTIKRGINLSDDLLQGEALRQSEKDRAENIMIVDLLRNDIGKICKFNSVKANPLFEIEKYETLYQMTSTVTGELQKKSFGEIIRNLFPCGSITGAPKIRTMELIHQLEKEERGIYTGTIGIINYGDFIFNIPIRTITLNKHNNSGELGLGSGIVWDSNPEAEFDEVKLKSHFFTNRVIYFELIETMLIENGEVFLLENHISRLKNSAEYFLFYFDEAKFRKLLNSIIIGLDIKQKFKLRTLLTKWGEVKYNLEKIDNAPSCGKIAISDKTIDKNNPFQYFKTTNRELLNAELLAHKEENVDDVIFLNNDGNITEGAITNIAIVLNGKTITPPVNDGLLKGCYREFLLSKKDVIEKSFGIAELLKAEEIIIFNSVRKKIKVKEILYNGKRYRVS